MNVVADAGYSNGQQAQACEEAGITPYVPVQRSENNQDGGIYFDRSAFTYDAGCDAYRCPAGELLRRKTICTVNRLVLYTTSAYGSCALKPKCTRAKQRWVSRHFEEEALERMRERLAASPRAMALRRKTAEHAFANLKYRIPRQRPVSAPWHERCGRRDGVGGARLQLPKGVDSAGQHADEAAAGNPTGLGPPRTT